MGKRDSFWEQVPEDAEGQILWPEDAGERLRLVRDACGAKVVGLLKPSWMNGWRLPADSVQPRTRTTTRRKRHGVRSSPTCPKNREARFGGF
jgi:hypothetical protein